MIAGASLYNQPALTQLAVHGEDASKPAVGAIQQKEHVMPAEIGEEITVRGALVEVIAQKEIAGPLAIKLHVKALKV